MTFSPFSPTNSLPIEERLRYPVKVAGITRKPMTLQERMVYHKVPGVSIAGVDQGNIFWAQGFGGTDSTTHQPVNEDTLFQACSISKMVTALGALLLVQEGKLDLDKDVSIYLKRWQVPKKPPYQDEPLTVRRLLSHTGGVTVPGVTGYIDGEQVPDVFDFLKGVKPLSKNEPVEVALKPGAFHYSGGGTTIVEILIEDITGVSFVEYIQKSVLDPLRMTRSFFVRPLPKEETNFATGHDHEGKPIPGKYHNHPSFSAAGLWTMPSDLIRLGLAIQQSLANKGPLTKELAQEMITPQERSEITGLGTFIRVDGNVFGHSGSNPGMRCFANFTTDGQKGVVIMTNGDNGEELEEELRCSVYDAYGWPLLKSLEKTIVTVPASILQSYEGDYWFVVNKGSPKEKTIKGCTIKVEGDHLNIQWSCYNDPEWMTYWLGPWVPFFPEASSTFFNLYGMPLTFEGANQFERGGEIYVKRD